MPGQETEGAMAFRFTSPKLRDVVLRECPVSVIMRESPHIYQVINAAEYVNRSGIDDHDTIDHILNAVEALR